MAIIYKNEVEALRERGKNQKQDSNEVKEGIVE